MSRRFAGPVIPKLPALATISAKSPPMLSPSIVARPAELAIAPPPMKYVMAGGEKSVRGEKVVMKTPEAMKVVAPPGIEFPPQVPVVPERGLKTMDAPTNKVIHMAPDVLPSLPAPAAMVRGLPVLPAPAPKTALAPPPTKYVPAEPPKPVTQAQPGVTKDVPKTAVAPEPTKYVPVQETPEVTKDRPQPVTETQPGFTRERPQPVTETQPGLTSGGGANGNDGSVPYAEEAETSSDSSTSTALDPAPTKYVEPAPMSTSSKWLLGLGAVALGVGGVYLVRKGAKKK